MGPCDFSSAAIATVAPLITGTTPLKDNLMFIDRKGNNSLNSAFINTQ